MPPKILKAQQPEQRTGPRLALLTAANFQLQVNNLRNRANATPKDPARYSLPLFLNNDEEYVLSLKDEIKLAESVAFIAAVEKGVEHVSASAIAVPEAAHDGLLFVIASNEGISIRTRDHLVSIIQAIEQVAAREISKTAGRDLLLTLLVKMNSSRINDRLKAKKRDKSIILQGLEQILSSIDQSKVDTDHAAILRDRVSTLRRQIQDYSIAAKSIETIEQLKDLTLACHRFWAASGSQSTRNMLAQIGTNVQELKGNPCLLQIAKIAAYSHISQEIIAYASDSKYRNLFQHITIQYVSAYGSIPSAIPTAIKGPSTQCRVHAEVQLIIELDTSLSTKWKRPRAIGSSKAACFLCDLFMHKHGLYFVPRSHGVLTSLWVIPDPEIMTKAQKQRYRQIIKAMSVEIIRLTNLKHPYRVDPATSWQNFSQLEIFRDSPDTSGILNPMSGSQPILTSSVLEGLLEEHSVAELQVKTTTSGCRPVMFDVDVGRMLEHDTALSTAIGCNGAKAAEAESVTTPDARKMATSWTLDFSTRSENGSTPTPLRQSVVEFEMDKACQRSRSSSTIMCISKTTFEHFKSGNSGGNAVREQLTDAGAQAREESVDTLSAHDEPPVKAPTRSDSSSAIDKHKQTLDHKTRSSWETTGEHKPEDLTDPSSAQKGEQSNDIRGHESQSSGSAYQDSSPRQHQQPLMVCSDKVSQSINFHDLEIFLEAEEPATMLVDIVYNPTNELSTSTTEEVDIGKLKLGEELLVYTRSDVDGSSNLRMRMQARQNGFGKSQRLEMRWKLTI